MDRLQNFILVLLLFLFVGLGGYFLAKKIKPGYGVVNISSNKPASVYIDNQQVGKVPYIGKTPNRQISVRVIPDDFTIPPFEEKLPTLAGKTSILKVYFGKEMAANSVSIIYPEKTTSQESELSIISLPQTAQVRLDGQVRGFTPVKLNPTLGKHNIEVSFEGYKSETFEVETFEGLKVIVVLTLGKDLAFAPSPTPMPPSEEEQQQAPKLVEILDTPTGFLRVRLEPSSGSTELGQVKPGDKYDYVESTSDNSWHKILFEERFGWVSAQYTKIVEN